MYKEMKCNTVICYRNMVASLQSDH